MLQDEAPDRMGVEASDRHFAGFRDLIRDQVSDEGRVNEDGVFCQPAHCAQVTQVMADDVVDRVHNFGARWESCT